MQKIITRSAEISLGNDGIVRKKFFNDIDIDVEDGRENLAAVTQLTGGKPYLVVSDGRVTVTVTPEAREFAASEEASKNRIAEAILVNSVATRLTANFYIRFNKPRTPTRIFTDEQKAIEWLRKFQTDKPEPVAGSMSFFV
jgi:hypothetical protein